MTKALEQLIQEVLEQELSIIKEADIRQVHPKTMGAYAFVLAYNDGIAKGLFPRSEPVAIAFSDQTDSFDLRGNTAYFPVGSGATVINSDTYIGGSGHDLMHLITQNLFKHFQKRDSAGALGSSKNNKSKLNQKGFEQIDKMFAAIGVDMKKELRMDKMPEKYSQASHMKIQMQNILDYHKDKFQSLSDYSRFSENIKALKHTVNYFDSPIEREKGTDKALDRNGDQHITHSVEENMGNIVSDVLAPHVSSGEPFTAGVLKVALDRMDAVEDTSHERFGEFQPNDAGLGDIAIQQIEKWKSYFHKMLPAFADLYNKRLATLKKTQYGKQYAYGPRI